MTEFFHESTDQSEIKAAIVSKYIWAWANVIKGTAKKRGSNMAYIDLFAGPGRYVGGTKSTPLMVLEQAIKDPDLCNMLVTVFNDADEGHASTLKKEIAALPGIENMKHEPSVQNNEVGEEIVKVFEDMNLVPTFFFVDPWGYKGLSLRLINSVLKDWGCDCIFFFNYNRINMGLGNEAVKEHIDVLFGEERADELREELDGLGPRERELAVVEAIGQSLQAMGGKYVLPFRFRRAEGKRTSHHLIFVSKHTRGYNIMKDIMARESSGREQGVPTFEYNPSYGNQGLLFELARPLDDLGEMLLDEFSGKTMTMNETFEAHHIGRRFIKRNYKEVLKTLEANGEIDVNPPADHRKKSTFADHVKVTFP